MSKWVGRGGGGRCVDGTRPRILVDKAVDGGGADLYSNAWLFYTGGEGGPCTGADRTIGCYERYVGNTTVEDRDALSSMHPDSSAPVDRTDLAGLFLPDGATNPFAAFNRVYVERCTTSGSHATEKVDLTWDDGTMLHSSPLAPAKAKVYHRGDALWTSIFKFLQTAEGRDLGGGGDDYVTGPDLPPIDEATTILLAGHSDAAKWMMHSADRLAGKLARRAPLATVKVVLDAHAVPSLQYEMKQYSGDPNMFRAPHTNTGGYLLPSDGDLEADEGFGNDTWLSGGIVFDLIDGLGTRLDKSCETAHGAGSEFCLDEMHVLFNHVTTPVFLRMDQLDDLFIGKPAQFGLFTTYHFPSTEFRMRTFGQLIDFVNNSSFAHEPPTGSKGIFAPATGGPGSHVGIANSGKSFNEFLHRCSGAVLLGSVNFAGALHVWLMSGTEVTAIEQATDADLPGHLNPGERWSSSAACS